MPRANLTKIKSALRRLPASARLFYAAAGLVILLAGVVGFMSVYVYRMAAQTNDRAQSILENNNTKPRTVGLKLENTQYRLEVADSSAARQRGLSYRQGLPDTTGMLFIYPDVSEYCMWMKDMNFAIDMIWLDSQKKVTKVQADVRPETYPETFCGQGQYVVELAAGEAARAGINPGRLLAF